MRFREWIEFNRKGLEKAGFVLEIRGDDDALTLIAESSKIIFQITEWQGGNVEFHAISFTEDKVIPVKEAEANLSSKDKCDYYIGQVMSYIATPF